MNNRISRREKEVLHLIAHERTINEIADELYISHHTVISHRKKILAKMKVRNTAGMIRRAFEMGLLTLTHQSEVQYSLNRKHINNENKIIIYRRIMSWGIDDCSRSGRNRN